MTECRHKKMDIESLPLHPLLDGFGNINVVA